MNMRRLVITLIVDLLIAAAINQAKLRGIVNQTQTVVQEENSVINAVEKVSPSVIAIGVSRRVINAENLTIGSGFVVYGKGIIVTNKHVVANPDKYTVVTKDGKKYDVKKIYKDPVLDLAIVQIDGSDIPVLDLGDSSKLKVGQSAIAIGNALGKYTNTVTTGVVSGLGRSVIAEDPFGFSAETLDNLIQTDAAINPGNSGGPLLNSAGQVIGVNVATTQGAQNIGFAIPINSVKQIITDFATKGFVSKPFLGINYRFITKDLAILDEIPQGDYIQDIANGSPAEKAGIQRGDIITKVKGVTINSENIISDIISKSNTGDKLDFLIWRDGTELKITATIEEFPNQ